MFKHIDRDWVRQIATVKLGYLENADNLPLEVEIDSFEEESTMSFLLRVRGKSVDGASKPLSVDFFVRKSLVDEKDEEARKSWLEKEVARNVAAYQFGSEFVEFDFDTEVLWFDYEGNKRISGWFLLENFIDSAREESNVSEALATPKEIDKAIEIYGDDSSSPVFPPDTSASIGDDGVWVRGYVRYDTTLHSDQMALLDL